MATPANQKILGAIISFIEEHGYAPTVEEISGLVGYSSKSTTWTHLKQMFSTGMLETDNINSPRAIRVPGYKFVKEG